MRSSDEDMAHLMTRAAEGDADAAASLMPQVYDALHALARRAMAREPSGLTLQATALVNEAYLRLVGDRATQWNGRAHFYGAAAQAMRRILVESARKRGRLKHGGAHTRVPLERLDLALTDHPEDLLALDAALDRLQERDPRAAEIIMLRFFAGLSEEDTARALAISARTVRREWSFARLWLYEQIAGSEDTPNDV